MQTRRTLVLMLASFAFTGTCVAAEPETNRPIGIGAGFGYAMQGNSPYEHGMELRAFLRMTQANLQPRIEYFSQHFDLDASQLTQVAAEPQVVGGERNVRAGLAGVQWSLGRPKRVRPYALGELGYSWLHETMRFSDDARLGGTEGAWIWNAGGGLEISLGKYGALLEARYSHRQDDPDAFYPAHTWSTSAGFVF